MPDIAHFSDSDADSFHSFDDNEPSPPPSPKPATPTPSQLPSDKPTTTAAPPAPSNSDRFPPEEEASLLKDSHTLKSNANSLFGQGNYSTAIQTYDRALASCPVYLDYEIAVLRSNIAACHLKLEEWKEAITSAEKGLDCLERLEPLPQLPKKPKTTSDGKKIDQDGEDEDLGVVEDLSNPATAARLEALQASGQTIQTIRTLQTKLLTRRARARSSLSDWASLQGAEEDYRLLLSPPIAPFLTPSDRNQILVAVRALGPKLDAAKEREMAEMMGKLKGLGNSVLKPFGLSTENFKFVKDEKTGGYSMNFTQNPGKE
jgi:tetratricopeptide (TPR) repeat protein